MSIIVLIGVMPFVSGRPPVIPQKLVDNGRILYGPIYSKTTYLLNLDGTISHTWTGDYYPGEAVRWLGNGMIMRTIKTTINGFGGAGGGVQKVLWNGTVVWEYHCDTNGNISHHDITILPNGDVLMIVWETKTKDQAIAAGRDPSTIPLDYFCPDKIIEVKPTGPTSGDVVWEWHSWDHMIQDYDASKTNYENVAAHPELIDINYGGNEDWLHTNSIDYNAQFDQILISVHNFNEIWIIDHSTTTAKAAGHTGGKSGHGGDLLYRWGNPQAYCQGGSSDEKLFWQHDASWIKEGCPGAGHILIFNNGANRPEKTKYSTVEEIVPPVNSTGHYYYIPGTAYGPENTVWSYVATPPSSFFCAAFGSAERLRDGTTLICKSVGGEIFIVSPSGTTTWQQSGISGTPWQAAYVRGN